jgi:hypothetical protein
MYKKNCADIPKRVKRASGVTIYRKKEKRDKIV